MHKQKVIHKWKQVALCADVGMDPFPQVEGKDLVGMCVCVQSLPFSSDCGACGEMQ